MLVPHQIFIVCKEDFGTDRNQQMPNKLLKFYSVARPVAYFYFRSIMHYYP